MNSYTHSECPICHFSFPTSAMHTHLIAHEAGVWKRSFAELSSKDLAQALSIEFWVELWSPPDPRMIGLVEAVIERLKAIA